jgi:regulator of sirC expression with transglutaminase-like and TPR domain
MKSDPNLERFAELARSDDNGIRLDEGALEIARIAYPDLDPAPTLKALDDLASRIGSRNIDPEDSLGPVRQLTHGLFVEEGFQGNRDDYYDPRNSYLNDVVENRQGISITLAVIFLEVARRLELPAEGVGFPAHFLVRASCGDRDWLIDPFRDGRLLTLDDCQNLVDQTLGVGVQLDPAFLEPVGPRYILARMLRNLKTIFVARKKDPETLAVQERLVLLRPDDLEERRDRGKARLAVDDTLGAAGDLEDYLIRSGKAEDSEEIRSLLHEIRRRQAMVN